MYLIWDSSGYGMVVSESWPGSGKYTCPYQWCLVQDWQALGKVIASGQIALKEHKGGHEWKPITSGLNSERNWSVERSGRQGKGYFNDEAESCYGLCPITNPFLAFLSISSSLISSDLALNPSLFDRLLLMALHHIHCLISLTFPFFYGPSSQSNQGW